MSADHRIIIQISDTHLVAEGKLHDKVDTAFGLQSVLAHVESSGLPIDAIVFSGDLADSGDPAEYERVREVVMPFMERLDVPFCFMPGNHDEREAFRAALLDGDGEGNLDQVFWVGGLRILAIDSTVPGHHHGSIEPEQLEFIANELATPAPEGTLLALHHPPLWSPIKLGNIVGLREPEQLAEVIAGSDVMMILAGHAHHTTAAMFAGIPCWVSTASAYQADVMAGEDTFRGIPGVAFTRVDVREGVAYATQIAMAIGEAPIYELDVAMIERHFMDAAVAH